MAFFQAGKYRLPLGKRTYVMGILNVTPDSFSDGGLFEDPQRAAERALELERAGADFVDIGGQSTRPGYEKITWEEEWGRLAPVLSRLQGKLSVPLSVDTFYPEVAFRALGLGADLINDVTGFEKEMLDAVASFDCGCIVMYPGPGDNPLPFYQKKIKEASSFGICRERLCFDPGIGFGKTYEENLRLLGNFRAQRVEGCAMLIAASRKRVIGESCGNPPFEERLAGTLAAHTLAVAGGADIVRVHDVREALQACRVADAILYASQKGGFC